jgi:hypothetical protein
MSSNTNPLEIQSYDDKEKMFLVKSPSGNVVKIQDTFAEMFGLWAGRVLITAQNEKWAQIAASLTTGFATSELFQQTRHLTNDLEYLFKFIIVTALN